MNRIEAVKFFSAKFRELGIEEHEAETEARFALSSILNCDISSLYIRGTAQVSESDEYRMAQIVKRRAEGEPLEYILVEKWFMGLKFRVTPAVLIPRRETELLCETAIQTVRIEMKGRVLDLCTGSGCIAVSIARYTRARITACDISEQAAEVARFNAKNSMVGVDVRVCDLFSEVPESFDIITANPPYIPSGEIDGLMKEVRDYEPRLALDAGRDGLKFYRRIAAEAPEHLNQGGVLIMEIGCEQAADVKGILSDAGFCDIRVMKDYSQLDRIVAARVK